MRLRVDVAADRFALGTALGARGGGHIVIADVIAGVCTRCPPLPDDHDSDDQEDETDGRADGDADDGARGEA